jgi:hypothetical protein
MDDGEPVADVQQTIVKGTTTNVDHMLVEVLDKKIPPGGVILTPGRRGVKNQAIIVFDHP